MNASHRARYSGWTGARPSHAPDDGAILDALADSLLSDGVDSTLSKALHQGLDIPDDDSMPGLDSVVSNLRSEQRSTLDELLEQVDADSLASSAASMDQQDLQRLMNALRAHSQAFAGLLADASEGQRADLTGLIQAAAPGEAQAVIPELLDHLVNLAVLERQVRQVRNVADVQHIDPDTLRSLLGEHIADDFMSMAAGLQHFAESGHIVRSGSRATLSARAVQHIGDALLQATLTSIQSRSQGDHQRNDQLQRHEPTGTSRDYQFGDPFELDIGRSLLDAVKRKPGAPVQLDTRDLKVVERESTERATTILAIDLSRSMGERGYLLAAKKLALALTTFIRRRFAHDELYLIGFSETARQIHLQELIDLQWDRYGFGTNVHDALRVANGMLAAHRGRKRNLVLITDGEPTAHRNAQGEVVFNHPPDQETLLRTHREADRLRRDGVYLLVCLLSADRNVGNFGQQLARHAAGDVMMTDPDDLTAELIVRYNRRGR